MGGGLKRRPPPPVISVEGPGRLLLSCTQKIHLPEQEKIEHYSLVAGDYPPSGHIQHLRKIGATIPGWRLRFLPGSLVLLDPDTDPLPGWNCPGQNLS